jgi:cell division protein ZapA
MADVRLNIAGREYIVTCKDGEESRLVTLGQLVDEKAREAGGGGGLNESRQLLFAGLLLADRLHEVESAKGDKVQQAGPVGQEPLAEQLAVAIERLADRIESIAVGLEERT